MVIFGAPELNSIEEHLVRLNEGVYLLAQHRLHFSVLMFPECNIRL